MIHTCQKQNSGFSPEMAAMAHWAVLLFLVKHFRSISIKNILNFWKLIIYFCRNALIIKVPQNFSMTKSDYYRVNLAPLQYANSRKKSTAHCCNYTHRFESPPPPYSYYPSPLIQRIHQPRSSPPPPPLPPREKVIIGRRAARFDIRIPNKTSPISKQSNLRRNNLSFQKQYINPIISSSRSCTDGFWCFVFLIFLSGWVFVAAIGLFLFIHC